MEQRKDIASSQEDMHKVTKDRQFRYSSYCSGFCYGVFYLRSAGWLLAAEIVGCPNLPVLTLRVVCLSSAKYCEQHSAQKCALHSKTSLIHSTYPIFQTLQCCVFRMKDGNLQHPTANNLTCSEPLSVAQAEKERGRSPCKWASACCRCQKVNE